MVLENNVADQASNKDHVPLKRSIGLWLLIFYGLGNILGAGIYVLVGKVAGAAGYGAPLSFIGASIAAGFTAFTYGELAARYPVSAGEAVYLYKGFHLNWLSTLVGLLLTLSGIASAAAIANGFAGYFQTLMPLPDTLLIISLILSLGLIAIWGIGESVKLAAVFTTIEILGLLIIAGVGIYAINLDDLSNMTVANDIASYTPPDSHTSTVNIDGKEQPWHLVGIFTGAFLAFYAFIGFEDMINIAEEVKRPQRTLPQATIASLIIATVLYGLISIVAIAVVPPVALSESDAPLALVYQQATGQKPLIITIICLFAVINGALIQIIMGSRILYGMANNGWMPALLGRVNPATQTPIVATLVVVSLLLVFALLLPLLTLVELTSYLILIVFTLVNWALIRIKKQDPTPLGVSSYPMYVPVTGMVLSLAFVVIQLLLSLNY